MNLPNSGIEPTSVSLLPWQVGSLLLASSLPLPTWEAPYYATWIKKIPWRKNRVPTPVFWGFPGDSDSKEFTCNVGDLALVPELGRSPGGGHGNPLQYSCLKNPHGQRSLAGYSP